MLLQCFHSLINLFFIRPAVFCRQSSGLNSLIKLSTYTSGASSREKLIGVPFAPAMEIGCAPPVTGSKSPSSSRHSEGFNTEEITPRDGKSNSMRRGSGVDSVGSSAHDAKGKGRSEVRSAKVLLYERIDGNRGSRRQPTQDLTPARSIGAMSQMDLRSFTTVPAAPYSERLCRDPSVDSELSQPSVLAGTDASSRPTEPFMRYPSQDTDGVISEVATNFTATPARIRTHSDSHMLMFSPGSEHLFKRSSLPSQDSLPALMIHSVPSSDVQQSNDRGVYPQRSSTPRNVDDKDTRSPRSRPSMFFGNRKAVQDSHLSSQQFAYCQELKALFSCGHWDRTFRVTAVENGNLIQSVRQHRDIVTCISTAKDFGQHWLATGSRDCTVMVWRVCVERESQPLDSRPLFTLYGHDDSVTSLVINAELDVVVSGSDDSTIIVHNLRDGTYIRSIADLGLYASPSPNESMQQQSHYRRQSSEIKPHSAMPGRLNLKRGVSAPDDALERGIEAALAATSNRSSRSQYPSIGQQPQNRRQDDRQEEQEQSVNGREAENAYRSSISSGRCSAAAEFMPTHRRRISWIGLSKKGYIVSYSADDHTLSTFSLNGQLLVVKTVPEALYACILSEDGKVLITGGSGCLVVFRWVCSKAPYFSKFISTIPCVVLYS